MIVPFHVTQMGVDTMKTYDVYVMDKRGNAKRVAHCHTLHETRTAVKPYRAGYVYVIATNGKPTQPRYVWGCVDNRPHRHDLRNTVRDILRS